jgi:glucoamylase
MGQGIFNEIYWPAVDQPEVKDFGFLVAGDGWWREVKRVDRYEVTPVDVTPGPQTVTHTVREADRKAGRDYTLTLRPVVHPQHDVLLIAYDLHGTATRFHPLLAPHLGISQFTSGPVDRLGTDNHAWVDPTDLALFASGGGRYLCLLSERRFTKAGVGYVGDTDGWADLDRHDGVMELTYTQAGPGVLALTGELPAGSGLLALGFGESEADARAAAQTGLDTGYQATVDLFKADWREWASQLRLPELREPAGLADALRHSAVVLRSHADHTTAGAYVASLSIPWGADTNTPEGYHVVWPRDAGQTVLALAAVGHTDDALAAMEYLASTQDPSDGSWPRNFFVSPPQRFDPDPAAGHQLDEVAFPLLLAGKLDELGVGVSANVDQAIRRAARYLAINGPVSDRDVDRWEENPGASPFTMGLEIVALLVAATRLTGEEQTLALDLADNWNERLEEYTYVAGDELDEYYETAGHYVRIGLPGTRIIQVGNQPKEIGRLPMEAAALIGMEFLYLPRLGLRDPHDSRITDTLKVAEDMLGVDTPRGRAYHRYNVDGYGEWLDGSGWPRYWFGIGQPWPLLAGERGHYEVLLGREGDPTIQLKAMLAMRGRGGLCPEQVWSGCAIPEKHLEPGGPTTSAMPLAWAHSELIKLAVAAHTGSPVEHLNLVTDRYHGTIPQSQRWFWRDMNPVTALPERRALVIADRRPFTLHYGFNDWTPTTITERTAVSIGLGLFGVTFTPDDLDRNTSLQFVRRYPDTGWEPAKRHDVMLGVRPAPTVVLSPKHLRTLEARGIERPTAEAMVFAHA